MTLSELLFLSRKTPKIECVSTVGCDEIFLNMSSEPGEYSSAEILDADRMRSFRMMSEIERIKNLLPGMDCGSCGAPTCRAHAEDVVRGESKLDDCVIRMRELLRELERDDGK